MRRKRPCRSCRQWFKPHPRAGDRQRYCSSPACQRERHRRACERWRKKNPDYDKEERFRRKVEAEVSCRASSADVLRRLPLETARDAVSMEASVIIEEASKVLRDWTRDAVREEPVDKTKETSRLVDLEARDADSVGGMSDPALRSARGDDAARAPPD